MQTLKERIKSDLVKALKGGNKEETLTLRLLESSIKNREIDLKKRYEGLSDDEVLEVLIKEVKKRKEAIEAYEKGNREDLVRKESKELEILQRYLPKQLSDEEIEREVKNAIQGSGAKDIKDIGKVMALVMPLVKGRADGARVSQMVKEVLSKLT